MSAPGDQDGVTTSAAAYVPPVGRDPRVVVVIQARMGSSRRPGKVLAQLAGRPSLQLLIERVRTSKEADVITVAAPWLAIDDPIAALCQAMDVACHRGHPTDCLQRLVEAGRRHEADVLVRLTADCPLDDGGLIDGAVRAFLDGPPCALLTTIGNTGFPTGVTAEVVDMRILSDVESKADDPADREHVTKHLLDRPERYVVRRHTRDGPHGDAYVTIDTPNDLEHVRHVLAATTDIHASWETILAAAAKAGIVHPDHPPVPAKRS